ncbi:hypothetical protein JCM10450v2_004708 [Rhodotorula kratochvilovae]
MAYAGSHAQAALADDAQWATYAQAPAEQFALYDTHAQTYLAPGSAAPPYLEVGGAQDASIDPLDAYSYTDSTYTYAPVRSYSYGTTPSPALPALSPAASSVSASSPFSGLVSPYQHASAATTPDLCGSALLPPAHVQDGGLSASRSSPVKSEYFVSAGFAEMQESYLQQQQPAYDYQQEYCPPHSPVYTHTLPPPLVAAPPSTPRRQVASSSHLYRSPSVLTYSSSSSVSSPYHRPVTPRSPASYPSEAARGRRGSTGGFADSPGRRATPRKAPAITTSVDANGSPTKSIRRVTRLSIEVPPPSRPSLSASAPPTARPLLSLQQPFGPAPASTGLPTEEELCEASVREVEQLLGELGPILESSGYEHDALAASPMIQPGMAPISYDARALPPTSISISGVTLAEEDLRFLDDPSLCLPDVFDSPTSARAYPQSAPAWRTTFDLPPPPPPMQSSRSQHAAYRPPPSSYTLTHSASVGSLAPPPQNAHVRAYSAQGSLHPARDSAYPPSPAPTARRRRSSVDSAALAAPPPFWPSGTSYPYHPAFQQQVPAVLLPAPAAGLARPVTPPPRTNALSASVGPGSPATPKRKRGSPTKAKQPVAMFVNYSAQDAKKLLNGVAPSGSTKKRREEEDAFRQQRGESALPSVLAPPPLPFATGYPSAS